jgi:hypothetical protein
MADDGFAFAFWVWVWNGKSKLLGDHLASEKEKEMKDVIIPIIIIILTDHHHEMILNIISHRLPSPFRQERKKAEEVCLGKGLTTTMTESRKLFFISVEAKKITSYHT